MNTRTRPVAVGGLLVAGTLLLSACGSSSTSGQEPAAGSMASTSAGATGAVKLGTTEVGKALVGPNGKTLYAFAKDTKGHSACTGECATYWPPVPSSDAPKGHARAITAKFGSIERADGSSQLTVNGYPMYTYVGDDTMGQANGQGLNTSGGLWWVVSGDGSWVTDSAGSTPSPSTGGGGGGY